MGLKQIIPLSPFLMISFNDRITRRVNCRRELAIPRCIFIVLSPDDVALDSALDHGSAPDLQLADDSLNDTYNYVCNHGHDRGKNYINFSYPV